MEVGLHEVMAMAEGMLFRFERTGDRHAPPGHAMSPCSVRGAPFWYQIDIKRDAGGGRKARVSLRPRHGEDALSWELWVDDSCRWDGRLHGGGELADSARALDDAIAYAIGVRNAGLKQ